jgi:hypothetical protein
VQAEHLEDGTVSESRLRLVDLAGSERIKRSAWGSVALSL